MHPILVVNQIDDRDTYLDIPQAATEHNSGATQADCRARGIDIGKENENWAPVVAKPGCLSKASSTPSCVSSY